MQISRLFEIIYILLNRKTITAKELAERFEVSVRTIYRDVEALSSAGIPIYMSKGKGGGIRLLENFVLNKSILSDGEQGEILAALQSLNAIKYPDVDNVISKLGSLFNKSYYNWIDIDFSHWGSNDREKFNLLKSAIISSKIITFDYFGSHGEKTNRRVEPQQLLFKNSSWYLKSYCLSKQALRVFKLSRIKNIEMTEETFDRELPQNTSNEIIQSINYKAINLKLYIQSSAAYRVYDEFDEKDIIENDDGSFTVNVSYPENEWVYGYILSFGRCVEVMEPLHIREIIRKRLEETLQKYL